MIVSFITRYKNLKETINFDDDYVHKWLYKCNQYFNIEEVVEVEKLRITSYYIDDTILYWHYNFMKGRNGQWVT